MIETSGEQTATGVPAHDLLLALAGHLDDDLLAFARELVAVGEEDRAFTLVTASVIAERTALPEPVRAMVAATGFAPERLPPAAGRTWEHRFAPAAADDPVFAALRSVPHRLTAGCRVGVALRLTPAGSAPGPVPHPVVIVRLPEDDRPADALAYQLGVALDRAGVRAGVEVLLAGGTVPGYQAAALDAATGLEAPQDVGGRRRRPEPDDTVYPEDRYAQIVAGPAVDELDDAHDRQLDEHEHGSPPVAADLQTEPDAAPDPGSSGPISPDPVSADTADTADRSRDGHEPPLPVREPGARLAQPLGPIGDDLFAAATPASPPPMASYPVPPRAPRQDGPHTSWPDEWHSGDWAMPSGPHSLAEPTPPAGTPDVGSPEIRSPLPPPRPSPGPPHDRPRPRPAPAPPSPSDVGGFVLRPESIARLTDEDRQLLARLQDELNGNGHPG